MLFRELQLKDFKFKNRIVMAPMCMYQADSLGFVNDFHLIHYGARALGGVGCVILEATAVEARGRISERDLCIYSDE
ncbi:MAG TPA: NADPH dehydrogenase, partial [Acholeplasmataceae bacterium]|nr:NADPH dehydrogenase [Acholeplasmataceae bacterium]